MLPGFRFLLAAILLSTSILVFGLGATALLRASHEQYVSNPSWRNGPQEQSFAQAAPEPAQPVLAALRVEPTADEAAPSVRDQIPTIGLPAVETAPEQMAAVTLEATAQPEPQTTSVAPPAEVAPPATETPAPEQSQAATETPPPAPADTLTLADTTASIPADKAAPVVTVPDVQRTPTVVLASRVTDIAAARVAALNDLAITNAKADRATPESKAAKSGAHKPKKRHRIVRRPPPPPVQQQAYYYPFMQQQQTVAATTATRPRQ